MTNPEPNKANTTNAPAASNVVAFTNPAADPNRGRAVEIRVTGSDEGCPEIWQTGEIVKALAADVFEAFFDINPRQKFPVSAADVRDPQPPYHVRPTACAVCGSPASFRQVPNIFRDLSGIVFKVTCSTCGKYLTTDEPQETTDATPATFKRHVYDDQEREGTRGEFFAAMNSGELVEIDDGWFEEMLDCLPPKGMNCRIEVKGVHRLASFLFAEGWMMLVAFWTARQADGSLRYFCQMTDTENPDR